MREDLERLKKIRSHRGLRHYWPFESEDNIPRLPEEGESQ